MIEESQIERLLDELYELRVSLSEISRKASRMELAVKRIFPKVSSPRERAAKRDRANTEGVPTITEERALAFFDELRSVVSEKDIDSGMRKLNDLDFSNLRFLAKELGISLGKSKPTRRKLASEIMGRVHQSIMLGQHTPVGRPEEQ